RLLVQDLLDLVPPAHESCARRILVASKMRRHPFAPCAGKWNAFVVATIWSEKLKHALRSRRVMLAQGENYPSIGDRAGGFFILLHRVGDCRMQGLCIGAPLQIDKGTLNARGHIVWTNGNDPVQNCGKVFESPLILVAIGKL